MSKHELFCFVCKYMYIPIILMYYFTLALLTGKTYSKEMYLSLILNCDQNFLFLRLLPPHTPLSLNKCFDTKITNDSALRVGQSC